MFGSKWISEKQFQLISLLLFLFLFFYLILRAVYVDLLHDEAATLLHYIETGYFFGPKSITDANNHLLNSIICHGLYRVFGENHFLFRLPNLISFPLYFWAIYQLISSYKSVLIRLLVLLGTTCIPFILEYFANCRGYGISMAFFMASLVFLKNGMQSLSLRNHALVVVCLGIASYANLTFLVSSLLASVFILIQQYRQRSQLKLSQQLIHFPIHFFFALALVPAGIYARVLKNGGALYYGRLDGLWEVTGTTLSSYTLFTNHIALKWILLAIGVALILLLAFRWWKIRFKPFFEDSSTLLAWFLFGHLFVIVVMAKFMEVNYPEDRVGMYLIPLFLLLFANELYRFNSLHFLFAGFLFFPLTFLPRINLQTSVFSPDDRMTSTFYAKVDEQISDKYTSVSLYHLMRLTWALQNRHSAKRLFPMVSNSPNEASDLFLSRANLKIPASDLKVFDTLFYDNSNGFIAYKRKFPLKKKLVFDTLVNTLPTNDMFIGVRTFMLPDSLKNRPVQIHVSGEIEVSQGQDEIGLVYSLHNKKGESIELENWVTRWSNGPTKKQKILINYPIDHWKEGAHEVRIYFFNRLNAGVALKNIKFELLLLE